MQIDKLDDNTKKLSSLNDVTSELKKKYDLLAKQRALTIHDIKPEDVDIVLDEYSKNVESDIYSIADALHLSRFQIAKLLAQPEYKDKYDEAKIQRAHMCATKGLKIAGDPYYRILENKPVSRELLKAAQHYSNYLLTYAERLEDKRQKNDSTVNIQINVSDIFKF